MGGKVHVESEGIGHGTTFVITMQSISRIKKLEKNLQINKSVQ